MTAFLLIALFTLGTAAVALSLRNIIRAALLLVASWAGISAFYLWAGAEFVAFAQLLVYVGAVSMVVLFAVLLTRHSRIDVPIAGDAVSRAVGGLIVGGAVLGVLFGAIAGTPLPSRSETTHAVTVKQLGTQLMNVHTAGVLIVGVILTVALIGAVVLAAHDREERK